MFSALAVSIFYKNPAMFSIDSTLQKRPCCNQDSLSSTFGTPPSLSHLNVTSLTYRPNKTKKGHGTKNICLQLFKGISIPMSRDAANAKT